MKHLFKLIGCLFISVVLFSQSAFSIGVFVAGFAATSGGANPGMHRMKDDEGIGGLIPGEHINMEWNDDQAEVVEKIRQATEKNPDEPVVLIGHSLGATTAVEMAFALKRFEIEVDVLVQLESIAIASNINEITPSNVKRGLNLWSTSDDTLNGLSVVEGSENIGIDGSNHADIDEPDDEGQTSETAFEGKNAWGIIQCVLSEDLKTD